jgi:hypothetical protein
VPVKSIFDPFFIVEDGVISFSLRDLTIIGCAAISIGLVTMLYQTCTNGYLGDECDIPNWKLPMVSAVVCLPIYDRIFCLLTAFFALGVHQVNIRAYFKVLYQVAPDHTNDSLFWLGIASCFSLPLIGVFDEHEY